MTQPTETAALTEQETEAVNRAALFWYVGEGAMEGPMYEALHTALVKLFPAKPAEVKS